MAPVTGRRRGATLTVSGTVHVPGDKSISHRALIFAALSTGKSRLRGILESADIRSTAAVLRELGVAVPPPGAEMQFSGPGPRALSAPANRLDCGNSGTTARLLAGVVSGSPFAATFVGDESLSRRPMRRLARPLEAMGASFEFAADDGLPMTVRGATLGSIEWEAEVPSAQIKSAVLLAAAVSGVRAVYREQQLSRDHTERMLDAAGAPITVTAGRIVLEPVGSLAPVDMTVPGDPSSAAYIAALTLLAGDGEVHIPGVCANPRRTAFLALLGRLAKQRVIETVDRSTTGGEPVADFLVRASRERLQGVEVRPGEVPDLLDELPLLAVVAARAEGETTVRGAQELRRKESDRIAAVVENLRAVGAEAEELPDGFVVRGGDGPFRGRVRTHGDHRIAMAFGVLAALPGNDLRIDDPGCVAVSYPGFWDDLRSITGSRGTDKP